MTCWRIATGAAIVMAMFVVASGAQPERGERLSVTGCPFSGVTASCLMLRAPDGTLYNISAASPRPRLGSRMIRVRGTMTDRASICGQGIVLVRIRWTRTRQHCPK